MSNPLFGKPRSAAGAADETETQTVSSEDRAAERLPTDGPSREEQREERAAEVPAGEPEAPTGPTAPAPEPEPGPQPEPGLQPQPEPEPEDADEDHEVKLARDLEELTAKAEKADEYLELAQRTKADFENYRRRAARESAAAQERGVARLAKELLPAVDNLDRALAAAQAGQQDDEATLADGIKLVHAEVISALARVGIEPFSPEGEQFDPQHHEAVAQQPFEGKEPGTVVEVYQRGYRLGETVLRPARVVVAG